MACRKGAGIGSRQTPHEIGKLMQDLWFNLGCSIEVRKSHPHLFRIKNTKDTFVLRSGGAKGADTFCATGMLQAGGSSEIYLPSHATKEALELAANFHPRWSTLNDYARALMARNCFQVLGPDLRDPSEFILCWTPDGEASGGTGQALRIAKVWGIPVFNLYHDNALNDFIKHCE